MMYVYELDRVEHLRDWLALRNEVYQPVDNGTGNSVWEAIAHGKVATFDPALRPLMSPKSMFFSELESLFVFDSETFEETKPQHGPQVLFGVKACDLTAIAYQDKHFEHDPYYQARRKKTLLVGIDCSSPCENGFCRSVDAGPQVKESIADLILTPMPTIGGDMQGWWLICSSNAGTAAVTGMDLRPADSSWHSWREMSRRHTEAEFKSDTHIINGIQRINARAVPDEHWDRFAHQCISCSGCSQVCPTCSCYTTRDNKQGDRYVRQRVWDSCLMVGFQKEASGANPAAQAGRRMYRFWYHKFSEDIVKKMGRYGCVGCGRCETTCPGSVGVHSIMEKISNA
jgi:formate hydrogenlyase subunit 6/NADH:ubiquinone oxidoreductase subunit I